MKHNGDSDAPVSEVIAGAGRLAVSLAEEVVLLRRIVQDQAALITRLYGLGAHSDAIKATVTDGPPTTRPLPMTR